MSTAPNGTNSIKIQFNCFQSILTLGLGFMSFVEAILNFVGLFVLCHID